MSDTPELSETKRALLDKYLRGELSQAARDTLILIQQPVATEATSEVRIQPVQVGGSRQPFFFLHGQWEEGLSFHCYPLARALGSDQPFYALEPYPLDGRQGLPTLEDIAAAHIKALRSIQPEGPYFLSGWCNGALVAYEMARQLQAVGQKIALLVLMDSDPLIYPARFRRYRTAFHLLSKLLRLNQVKELDWYLRTKHLSRYLRYALLKKKDPNHVAFKDLLLDYPRLFDWIAMGYVPSSLYDGKVTFFWADASMQAKVARKTWRKVEEKAEADVHIIPGDHITCRTDHLDVLADHLGTCIRQAQESAVKQTK